MSAQMSDSPHTTAPPVAGPASRYTAAWTTAQTPARGDAVGHGVAGSICDTPFGLRPRRGGARPCVHGQPGGVAVLTGWAARPARRRRPPAGARVWHTRAGGARIFPHVGWPRDGPSPAWSGTRSDRSHVAFTICFRWRKGANHAPDDLGRAGSGRAVAR